MHEPALADGRPRAGCYYSEDTTRDLPLSTRSRVSRNILINRRIIYRVVSWLKLNYSSMRNSCPTMHARAIRICSQKDDACTHKN